MKGMKDCKMNKGGKVELKGNAKVDMHKRMAAGEMKAGVKGGKK